MDTFPGAMTADINIALKTAILETRKKQKRIAKLSRIKESRLSKIVRGHEAADEDERARLSRVLGKSESELFPGAVTA